MEKADWTGVMSAITTPFLADDALDEGLLAEHVQWQIESGCTGIVALGSLGEGATLTFEEKVRVLEVCRAALAPTTPLVAGISGLSTGECVALARAAERVGCDGLMVLPPYVYLGDPAEIDSHFSAVIAATPLSCMLYNNPIAYGTNLTPGDVARLAERHANVHAIKESSGDVRRLTAVRERLGTRLALFAGLDDMALECTLMGGDGWVAGLVNALPAESVRLFELGRAGRVDEARDLYEWFLPLLRFDTVPKFVQLIKLVQAELGRGAETVRAPRLALSDEERADALAVLRRQIQSADRVGAMQDPIAVGA